MRVQVFSDNDWLYPDMETQGEERGEVWLHSARGAGDSFQVLTDQTVDGDTPCEIRWTFDQGGGITLIPCQLTPAHVERNSAATVFTTLDYEQVKHFVVRQAPYDVFEVTREIEDGVLLAGRIAFYFRVRVGPDAKPGDYTGQLTVHFAGASFRIDLRLRVYRAIVPETACARFSMVNWLKLECVEFGHQLKRDEPRFWTLAEAYLRNQLDMRNTHLQLPSGVPVRDPQGTVVDFDFSDAVRLGSMALDAGMNVIYGGFVARFTGEDGTRQYLLWDRQVGATSFEGYRQLRIYFEKLQRLVDENGWADVYMQGLVDEPQFANGDDYRILSGICRKFMPGIRIIDPVETTDIPGALEIWVIKQEVYEKHKAKFDWLQAQGEELWIYTCGFPAGSMMNRATDLPLLAGRLPMWQCFAYGMNGFLHWGYNAYNQDPYLRNCWAVEGDRYGLPPGNGFVTYPGPNGPYYSVRGHLQRAGAEEAELLMQLADFDRPAAEAIVGSVCRSFVDYETSPAVFAVARRELLRRMDQWV